jgi:hypothetical protein
MSIDYCSVCKTATNMIVTVTRKAIADKDGKMKTITIKSYHCESCRSFIRSTDEKDGTTLFTHPRPFGERTEMRGWSQASACVCAMKALNDIITTVKGARSDGWKRVPIQQSGKKRFD